MCHFDISNHNQTSRRREDGFTLVELLVVLVILGLIIGIVAPQAMKYVGTSRTKAAQIQVERLTAILDLFYLDAGRYPNTDEGLDALLERPLELDAWSGPYIRKADALTDPWGNPYLYLYPGEHGEFDLYSFGADGKQGGQGQDADVNSWE